MEKSRKCVTMKIHNFSVGWQRERHQMRQNWLFALVGAFACVVPSRGRSQPLCTSSISNFLILIWIFWMSHRCHSWKRVWSIHIYFPNLHICKFGTMLIICKIDESIKSAREGGANCQTRTKTQTLKEFWDLTIFLNYNLLSKWKQPNDVFVWQRFFF